MIKSAPDVSLAAFCVSRELLAMAEGVFTSSVGKFLSHA